MIVNYKPMLWFMLQIVLLVLWYGNPSFAVLPMWVVWSPLIVVLLGLAAKVFENPLSNLADKIESKFRK